MAIYPIKQLFPVWNKYKNRSLCILDIICIYVHNRVYGIITHGGEHWSRVYEYNKMVLEEYILFVTFHNFSRFYKAYISRPIANIYKTMEIKMDHATLFTSSYKRVGRV